jgi:hypothetical protein
MTKIAEEIIEESRRRNAEAAAAAAFPHMMSRGHQDYAPGMTLRDYFAGKFMASMLGQSNIMESIGVESLAQKLVESMAGLSYAIADEMLKARAK